MTLYNVVSPGAMAAGQPEDISVVLANFQALANVINGNLDNSNLASGAGISASKLSGFPADAGKVLLGDGSWSPFLSPGVIVPYAGASPPTGWLMCDGAAVSRTTYSALFAVVGGTYGVGDGSTTFNLPDLRGRAVYGVGSGAPGVGYLGENDAQGTPSLRGPHHPHSVSDPGHSHAFYAATGTGGSTYIAGTGLGDTGLPLPAGVIGSGTGISVGPGGYSTVNAPSHIALAYIIRT